MIQVINRAFDILEIMAKDLDREYHLGELADKLKLNHGTCANIIKSMVDREYVEHLGKKRGYRLGNKAYYLTGNFSNKKELLSICIEPMKKLRAKLNESCIVAILKNDSRITLHKESSTHELQAVTNEEKNAYLTATGRAILACLGKKEQDQFIRQYGMPEKMWPEVKNTKDLTTELNKIKEKQIAIHYADSYIIGIGVPVFKMTKVVASLGVYLPEIRFSYKTQELILTEIKKAAGQISAELSKIN